MTYMKIITLAVLTALLLTACTPQPISLAGTAWKLVSIGPAGAETPALPGATVTLTFDNQGRAGGNAGCNTYGGDYTVSQGKLQFGQFMSTLMACAEDGVMQQETNFLAALEQAASYAINADQLVITSADGQTRLTFTRGQ